MSQDNVAGLLYKATTRPAIRPGARATRLAVLARHGLGRDTILHRDRGQKVASLRHGALARVLAATRQGTLTTRPGGGRDTVPCAPRHGAQRALCTRPSHSVRVG